MYNDRPPAWLDVRRANLLADRGSRREVASMNAFEHDHSGRDATASRDPQDRAALLALWLALDADRRARDERTARLRAMQLISGDGPPDHHAG